MDKWSTLIGLLVSHVLLLTVNEAMWKEVGFVTVAFHDIVGGLSIFIPRECNLIKKNHIYINLYSTQ